MPINTREIALDTLLELERSREYSHRLIRAVLDKYDYLESRDKAFVKRLTEGVTERRIELDYVLERFSSVPVRKLKPLIRCLLRMGVYQILHMDTVPDAAVCNEAVKLAGKRGFRSLQGFVNGVLRNVARQKAAIPWPDEKSDPVLALSVRHSMPPWLVSMWLDEYGNRITERLLEGLLQIRPVSIRFSGALSQEEQDALAERMRKADATVARSPYLPYAFLLENVDGVASLPGYVEGAFAVQDAASMLCMEAAGIGKGDTVLDPCAAPGGKSLFAAERAAKVIACDLTEYKTAMLEENRTRMGAGNMTILQWDATVPDESRYGTADILLLDVPCSGLGVMGKKRDIKYRVTPESLESITRLQWEIISACWRCVKPGGILLYSTCTVRQEENEQMVARILEELPFAPEPLEPYLPERLLGERRVSEELREGISLPEELKACCVQLFPGIMDTDGFFFARLKRVEAKPNEEIYE